MRALSKLAYEAPGRIPAVVALAGALGLCLFYALLFAGVVSDGSNAFVKAALVFGPIEALGVATIAEVALRDRHERSLDSGGTRDRIDSAAR